MAPTEIEIKPYHTTGKDDWGTEQALYAQLDAEFAFTLDAAAEAVNAKCPVYLTPQMDALSVDWWGRVFLNPPFTKVSAFLAKLIKELLAGHIEIVVAVVAARTDTEAWHLAQCYAGETRYLKGRGRYEIFPTSTQRELCELLIGVTIEPGAWAGIVKNVGLPKVAIERLRKDPTYQGPELTGTAPFPSAVLIFDRRKAQTTVYWDWRKKLRSVYALGPATKTVLGSPWLTTTTPPLPFPYIQLPPSNKAGEYIATGAELQQQMLKAFAPAAEGDDGDGEVTG